MGSIFLVINYNEFFRKPFYKLYKIIQATLTKGFYTSSFFLRHMTYELIITEKPSAAKIIADALADSSPTRKGQAGVYYYDIKHGGKDIVVACAVGHLYTVTEKDKAKGLTYPVFDIKWIDSASVNKASAFTKKYLTTIKKLAKNAKTFTVATDFDIEGEVIGYNIIRFACKQKDAKRMKFSSNLIKMCIYNISFIK